MDVQMRDEPGAEDTSPTKHEEVREAHHDAVAVPFTPTPTRPGMNPRATPWTPSTPRVRPPAFGPLATPRELGTSGVPGSSAVPVTPLATPHAPFGGVQTTEGFFFSPASGPGQTPGPFRSPRATPPLSSRRSHARRRDGGRRAHAPPSLPDDTRGPLAVAARPYNDYSVYFVVTGLRPQNFILDGASSTSKRLARFPTRRELTVLKAEHVARHAQPAMWLKCDLTTFNLEPGSFGNVVFDAIYLDPPWRDPRWPPARVAALRVDRVADPRGAFVFLWCGDGNDHTLERGRECLQAWGFRRVEEIVWLKTNRQTETDAFASEKKAHTSAKDDADVADVADASADPSAFRSASSHETRARPVLLPTKEHCLVGILGNLRRDRDGHIMHANIDVDVIVSEAPRDPSDASKPRETYEVIENFCQGRRRLELFGTDANRRAGWVTLGEALSDSNFDPEVLAGHFAGQPGSAAGPTLPRHQRIEALRPKTPPFARSGTLHP